MRQDITKWLKWLRSSIGFDAWRFDYSKGYSALLIVFAFLCVISSWELGKFGLIPKKFILYPAAEEGEGWSRLLCQYA